MTTDIESQSPESPMASTAHMSMWQKVKNILTKPLLVGVITLFLIAVCSKGGALEKFEYLAPRSSLMDKKDPMYSKIPCKEAMGLPNKRNCEDAGCRWQPSPDQESDNGRGACMKRLCKYDVCCSLGDVLAVATGNKDQPAKPTDCKNNGGYTHVDDQKCIDAGKCE